MSKITVLLLSALLTVLVSITASIAKTQDDPETVISDLQNWKHPTKQVLKKYGIKVGKVLLKEDGKYPVFFVQLPYDPLSSANEKYYNKFYLELLKANGWWNYALDDEEDKVVIRISWDKRKKTMHTDFEQKQ